MHDSLAVRRVDREPARELLTAKELSQLVEREIARDAGTSGRVQQSLRDEVLLADRAIAISALNLHETFICPPIWRVRHRAVPGA